MLYLHLPAFQLVSFNEFMPKITTDAALMVAMADVAWLVSTARGPLLIAHTVVNKGYRHCGMGLSGL